MRLETIKVVTDNEEGLKVINIDDFDPSIDKEWKPKTTRKKRGTDNG